MRKFLRLLMVVGMTIAVLLLLRQFFIEPIMVKGESMEPSLVNGERMLMTKDTSEIHRFDIVIFQAPDAPDKNYIKRVIGLPGDTVEMQNDQLTINNKEYDEPYLDSHKSSKLPNLQGENYTSNFSVTVPDGHYFVLGDNRPVSKDSRLLGAIDAKRMMGVGNFVIWPIERVGTLTTSQE